MTNEKPVFFGFKDDLTTNQQRSLPQLLEQIRDHAINELNELFVDMLDGADDALFDLADKAASNKNQALYFDSMRELRIKRKGIEKAFNQELYNNFQKLQKVDNSAEEATLDELPLDGFSLVQEDELEENLAFDSMIGKASKVNETALRQIVMRFDTLLANTRIDNLNNPVDPRCISEAFKEASHKLDLEIKSKLIVYKLFDRLVISELEHVYAEINSFLVTKGVLPDLPGPGAAFKKKQADKKKQAAQQRRASDSDFEENEFEDEYEDEGSSVGAEVLGALRELLSVQRSGGVMMPGAGVPVQGSAIQAIGPASAGPALVPVVDNQQLVQALSTVQADIQQQSSANATYVPVADLRGQLGTVLPVSAGVNNESIGQFNDDVIDIISMLFDFILDDKNLPDEFKALIGRLQIPMLKVAILDETFFSKGNHPARKLLNEMARSGLGWTQESDGNGVGLRDKVEAIVTRILNDFTDDVSLFTELYAEFREFNEEQLKRVELVEKRIKEAEEGKAKAETAKIKVEGALKKVVGDLELPEAVNKLIFEAWQSVMLLIFLREGDESDSWKASLNTTEELIESLKAPKTIEARKRLTGVLPGLVKAIKAGLDAVAYGEFESAQLFQDLEHLHLRVLKGEDVLEQIVPEVALDYDDEIEGEVSLTDNVEEQFADDLDFEGFEEEDELSRADMRKAAKMDLAQVTGNVEVDLDAFGLPDNIEEIDMRAPGSFAPASSKSFKGIPEDDQFLALVDTLQVGSWFEMNNLDKPTRCKLAAIIPTVGKYIFVNRTGIKIADYTRPGLALAMRRTEVTQLNDGALFDRALESIVSNLRSLKNTQDEGL